MFDTFVKNIHIHTLCSIRDLKLTGKYSGGKDTWCSRCCCCCWASISSCLILSDWFKPMPDDALTLPPPLSAPAERGESRRPPESSVSDVLSPPPAPIGFGTGLDLKFEGA